MRNGQTIGGDGSMMDKMRLCYVLSRAWKLFLALVISSTLFLMVMISGTQKYSLSLLQNVGSLRDTEIQRNNVLTITNLRDTCSEISHIPLINYTSIQSQRDILISKKYNFSVCNVPKSGSTFMKQIVFYLNDPRDWIQWRSAKTRNISEDTFYQAVEEIQSEIFEIPRMKVHSKLSVPDIRLTLPQFIEGNTMKVVLARNPYSRLYSAYVDKVFVPVMWSLQVSAFRSKLPPWRSRIFSNPRNCRAKHETFEDFLETVIVLSERGLSNIHWAPLSHLCAPCTSRPDVVIKQETYQSDMEYLLERLNVKGEKLDTITKAMAKKGVQTDVYLKGLVKTMLTRAAQGSDGDCFSKLELVQRVWQALKIQGQLYMASPFPFAKLAKNPRFDSEYAAQIFLEEMRKMPISSDESRSQRERALARAYRHVSQETIIKIQGLYYHDFKMFGYDFKPPTVDLEVPSPIYKQKYINA